MSTLAPISPPRAVEPHPDAVPQARVSSREDGGPAREAAPAMPNPSLRLDPALGLVVLEFRDKSGRTATLPTERELAAYRTQRGRSEGRQAGPLEAGGPGAVPMVQAGQHSAAPAATAKAAGTLGASGDAQTTEMVASPPRPEATAQA